MTGLAKWPWTRRDDMNFCVWCREEFDNPTMSREVWTQHRYQCVPALSSGSISDAPNMERWTFSQRAPYEFRWQPYVPRALYVYKTTEPGELSWKVIPIFGSHEAAIKRSKEFILEQEAAAAEAAKPSRWAPRGNPEWLKKMTKATAIMLGLTEPQAKLRLEILVGDMPEDPDEAKAAIDAAVKVLADA